MQLRGFTAWLVGWITWIVSLEAALNGTPLVGSTFGHELEYLENDAYLADPADEKVIRIVLLRHGKMESTPKGQLR